MLNNNEYLRNYFTTLQINIMAAFYLEYIPENKFEYNHKWTSTSDCYQLHYFSKGGYLANIGDITINPEEGDLVLFPAKIPLSLCITGDYKRIEAYGVNFNASFGGSMLLHNAISFPSYKIKTKNPEYVTQIFNELISKINEPTSISNELILKMKFIELFVYFIQNFDQDLKIIESSAFDELKPAFEYIENNLRANIKTKELADLVCLERSYFSRKFFSLMGIPPHKYIIYRKIEKAKLLLIHTGKPISEITEEVGFCNQNEFAVVFKKYTGISPSQYRRSHKSL